MAAYEWDPDLETGDALVDRQHRHIVELFEQLERTGDDPVAIMHVLDRLMEHVDAHFSCEEDLMTREEYPIDEAERHIEEHRSMTERARNAVLSFRAGEMTETLPLLEYLDGWLSRHVDEHDRGLIDYVRERRGNGSEPA